MSDYLFTSESVGEGHPDKVADQISDAILDAILAQDKHSRVAAETLCNTGLVVLAGEITTAANVDYIQVARDTIKRIGIYLNGIRVLNLRRTGRLWTRNDRHLNRLTLSNRCRQCQRTTPTEHPLIDR